MHTVPMHTIPTKTMRAVSRSAKMRHAPPPLPEQVKHVSPHGKTPPKRMAARRH